MILPDTIIYPETFKRDKPAGFNGIFNWKWTEGCFGKTKIKPMDFDGVVERHGHYIIFETKAEGKEIPQGQLITLNGLHQAKSFCVMKIWGKDEPSYFESIFGFVKGELCSPEKGNGVNEAREFLKRWFIWANKNK